MFETIVRYKSANEKSIFQDHNQYFDSILVSAHFLNYASGALPDLLREATQENGLNYYIDPIVSEFRIGNSVRDKSGDIRSWHRGYVSTLGDPLERVVNQNPNVNPRLLNDKDIEGIAESIVDFQEEFVYQMLENQVGKYADLDVERYEVQPTAVIPWVHKLETTQDYDDYKTILDASKRRSSLPLRPVLFTSTQKISRQDNREDLIKLLEDKQVEECFLLFDNLDKHETTESEYKSIISLVSELSDEGIDPYFYYGDFFSNLLHGFGLQGTAYSPLHGEQFKEKTEAQGQGGMRSRYYLDEVKDFLQLPAAVDIMTRADKPTCDCEFCDRHFDAWHDLVEMDQDEDTALQTLFMKHRIATRWNHTEMVQNMDLTEVVDEINDDFQEISPHYISSQQVASRKDLDYIQRWANAVEDSI